VNATGASAEYPSDGLRAWVDAWSRRRFRVACVVTALSLAATMSLLSVVLTRTERRTSVVALEDPVLAWLQPHDLTWLTFGIIYVGLAIALAHLAHSPYALVRGVRAYLLLMLLRALTMTLTPLAPPAGMIVLVDPFAQHVVATSVLTKDLFFSGHTSTMFLMFLVVQRKELKAFFAVATVIVGLAVLWQHVHYTIDVVAAPAFAYASWTLATRWTKRFTHG
jgi:membrane-associated phospholipid phosphatase